ncbi:hypothetical protein K525DRAFT_275131 [Schizophyllum commune Loenen D]|nr:hypothetical protein K525DRAFT_275131 [Schizophyllum commune Loenen D]
MPWFVATSVATKPYDYSYATALSDIAGQATATVVAETPPSPSTTRSSPSRRRPLPDAQTRAPAASTRPFPRLPPRRPTIHRPAARSRRFPTLRPPSRRSCALALAVARAFASAALETALPAIAETGPGDPSPPYTWASCPDRAARQKPPRSHALDSKRERMLR